MKLLFLGDSTMQYNDATTWPQVGWPQALTDKVNEGVQLLNFAKNGRSTRIFMELGHFAQALEAMDSDSIVLMEFGHNDGHIYDPERYTTDQQYHDNLVYMVGECRKRGADVILLTPIYRRMYLENGKMDPACHNGYPEACKRAGRETGTTVIDMTALTADLLEKLGPERSRELFMNFDAGIYPNYPDGLNDNTHLRWKGAEAISEIFISQIRNDRRFKGVFKMFKVIHVSPVSVSFEADNDSSYRYPGTYDIQVNGKLYRQGEDRNVFTVFGLQPGQEYDFTVAGEHHKATTLPVNKVINVLDHDIDNTGKTLVTAQIQKLLDQCNGDLLVFPKGTYYTAPLMIRSNTYIYLHEGATLLGSDQRSDYPIIKAYSDEGQVNASWEGEPNDAFMSLITSFDSENIMIVGEGTINGNADKADWWINHLVKRGAWRGNNVFINRCRNFALVGLHIINSPSWNLHPFYSDHLDFIDLTLKSIPTSPNTDGFDPESCTDMRLLGTRIYVGDDCVAIKSGKKIMADEHYRSTDGLVIRNCYMGEGHGGVVFGSESSCGIRNVEVSRCIFHDTDRGLRIKTKRGRGNKAVIENVSFDRIIMEGVMTPFVINMYYYLSRDQYDDYCDSKDPRPVDERTPHVGKFLFRNIECKDTKVCAGYFYGLPESKIEEIRLENVTVTYDRSFKEFLPPAMIYQCEKVNNGGFYFYNVEKAVMDEVYIEGELVKC